MARGKCRQYRWTAQGEQPIWAGRKQLENMGREWAYQAWRGGYDLITIGNVIHDQAAKREYERLKATTPASTPAG
jgi:uncharacterized protein with GYD domain